VQLVVTALISILPIISMGVRIFLLQHFWLALVASVLALVISCVLSCVPSVARSVPTNYILLFTFTILESYAVAFTCATVKDSMVVLAAAMMTAAVVVGLTLYAVFTPTDFTKCGGTMIVIGCAFMVFSLFSFLFGPTMRLIYCVLGVIVFGMYLIFDTQYIVGGERRQYSISKEDYIMGAMILYIDIINMFLFILELLKGDK
jgi:protein lifeguard